MAVGAIERLRAELQATSAELKTTRAELAAAQEEVEQLRLPAARYQRMRDWVPGPARRFAVKAYRAARR